MMRKGLRFLFLFVVALAFIPGKAYAWDFLPDGQMWAGDVDGNHCATVHAGEIYDAATYAVGSDPNKVSASVRVKLSDPSYGGRFYEYAQTFSKMESWDDFPEWLPAYVGVAQLIANGLIGDFNIYNSEAPTSLFEGAMIDFKRVLAGEDLSGGGSGGGGSGGNVNVSNCLVLYANDSSFVNPRPDYVYTHSYAKSASIDSSGNVVVGNDTIAFSPWLESEHYVSSIRFYVPDSVLESISSTYTGKKYVFSFVNTTDKLYGLVSFCVSDDMTTRRAVTADGKTSRNWVYFGDNSLRSSYRYNAYYDSEGVFVVLDSHILDSVSTTAVSRIGDSYMSSIYTLVPPSGDWPGPTTPVTPDPPEVPTPTAPTGTAGPDPTAPTITWPTSPTLVIPSAPVVETTPEGIDYTALLTLINDNLNSIDAYLQNFYSSFNSFRSDFLNGIDDIVDGLRNIYQYLGHLNNILEVHCKHITDQIEESVYNLELYIKRLFEWLPKQLNFDAEFDYDDSAVTTLLRRILNKIPGGSTGTPVTYKPNPQGDEPGFFDWLADLWHRFLIDLVSVLPDELGGLVDTISQLTHYFPFSIPWDMFALLALFAHDPVTPVFDVPWGYGGGEGEIQMVRVDLSAWDGVMETVRPVFLVGFCMQLAMITKDLLANFDLKQGGV